MWEHGRRIRKVCGERVPPHLIKRKFVPHCFLGKCVQVETSVNKSRFTCKETRWSLDDLAFFCVYKSEHFRAPNIFMQCMFLSYSKPEAALMQKGQFGHFGCIAKDRCINDICMTTKFKTTNISVILITVRGVLHLEQLPILDCISWYSIMKKT